jgi:hypothetical protein
VAVLFCHGKFVHYHIHTPPYYSELEMPKETAQAYYHHLYWISTLSVFFQAFYIEGLFLTFVHVYMLCLFIMEDEIVVVVVVLTITVSVIVIVICV